MLLTKYLTAVKVSIPAYNRSAAKSTRLFLSLLLRESSRQGSAIKLDTTLCENPDDLPTMRVVYKDNLAKDIAPGNLRIAALVQSVNAHSRVLALKEQVS